MWRGAASSECSVLGGVSDSNCVTLPLYVARAVIDGIVETSCFHCLPKPRCWAPSCWLVVLALESPFPPPRGGKGGRVG